MPTKFDVERAVAASKLPALAKLTMLTLGMWTDAPTAAIPPECRKSLADIADASSQSRRGVCYQLNLLESLGWIVRKRSNGGRNVRTGYRLLIGLNPAQAENVVSLEQHMHSKAAKETAQEVHSSRTASKPEKTVQEVHSKSEKLSPRCTRNNQTGPVVEGSVGRRNTTNKPDAARGTRLPEDWKPSPELIDWAYEKYPGVDADDQTDRFRDYWHAKAGAAARHVKWDLTWKNWIRRADDQLPDTAPPEAGRWD